jgi:protocatechuate 3,4-dioxygenase beta subunit
MYMKRWYETTVLILSGGILFLLGPVSGSWAATCTPTEPDMLGPFYKPDAPVRSSVGKGHVLKGVVRSSADCSPIPGAVLELWLAAPDGEYDDAHRATIIAEASGAYRFESSVPPTYYGRPPHIHLRVSAKGFKTLVTQHYPEYGKTEEVFDLVLVSAR